MGRETPAEPLPPPESVLLQCDLKSPGVKANITLLVVNSNIYLDACLREGWMTARFEASAGDAADDDLGPVGGGGGGAGGGTDKSKELRLFQAERGR